MEKDLITRLHKTFEDIVQHDEGVEFWYARDLQPLLEYTEWRNFLQVIEKAKLACYNARFEISDHFVNVNKMVDIGSGSQREIADIKLTRYACYLIAQNGDPKKETIAFAQTYFAIQTRKQELIEERLKEVRRIEQWSAVHSEGLQGIHSSVRHDSRANVPTLPAIKRET